ncbi:hypothetical protein Tco_1575534 [Tanacetum coccineum]
MSNSSSDCSLHRMSSFTKPSSLSQNASNQHRSYKQLPHLIPEIHSIHRPFQLKWQDWSKDPDLIEKYSVLPGPESVKNQESEKSPKEIIKAKKNKVRETRSHTPSRSTDKVDLEEF